MGIRLLAHGTIDDRDCAFPQAARRVDGTIICTYSNAGGQFATGGTDWAESVDGSTWNHGGTVLAESDDPPSVNFLKVSRADDSSTLFAYGARSSQTDDLRFGERSSEAILCRSADGGSTWSTPQVVPMPTAALEISHGVLAVTPSRLLAPAATTEPGRLGEQVVLAISDDGGRTWPRTVVAMQDPTATLGFLEHKFTRLPGHRILVTAWTVTLDGVDDRPNSYSCSDDDGESWSTPAPMGVQGQTLSAVHLRDDRFVVLYNRRYGQQGIVAACARFVGNEWVIDDETLLYDAAAQRPHRQRAEGVDEMLDFKFGFPTAIHLTDGTLLATYWSVEDERCGARWARFTVDS